MRGTGSGQGNRRTTLLQDCPEEMPSAHDYTKITRNRRNSKPDNKIVTGRVINHAMPIEAIVFF